jgi:hypothetical protein
VTRDAAIMTREKRTARDAATMREKRTAEKQVQVHRQVSSYHVLYTYYDL